MDEPLKSLFLGADFAAPKSGHWREKQPVLWESKGHGA